MKKMLSVSVLCLLSLSSISSSTEFTAEELLAKLSSRNLSVINSFAANFDYTRSPRVQAALLAEDIEWLNTRISKVQTAMVVYLSLHLTKKLAIKELRREDIEFKYLAQVSFFVNKIDVTMKEWKVKCREVKLKDLSGLYLQS